MTTASLTRPIPRPTATLSCQQVGGCSARATVVAIFIISLLVGDCLFCVWSRTEVVKEGYALSELNREIKKLHREHERLSLVAAGLRSPARIESIARERLGLQVPLPSQIRTVEYRPAAEDRKSLAERGRGKGGE